MPPFYFGGGRREYQTPDLRRQVMGGMNIGPQEPQQPSTAPFDQAPTPFDNPQSGNAGMGTTPEGSSPNITGYSPSAIATLASMVPGAALPAITAIGIAGNVLAQMGFGALKNTVLANAVKA